MSRLIESFLESGINVKLRHVATETKWEDLIDHGYIAVFHETGSQVLRRDGFQHNRKLRSGGAYDDVAIKAVVDETLAALTENDSKSLKEQMDSLKLGMTDVETEVEAKPGAAAA